jgi:hypothetical protein
MATPAAELSSASASRPNSKPPANRWCTYRSATPVALGVCCLLVSAINLWQAHQHSVFVESQDHLENGGEGNPGMQAQGTAVHKAVREFFTTEKNEVRKKQKQARDSGKAKTSGQRNGGATDLRAEAKAEVKAALDQDSPKYPTLECAAYGGPSPEIAQEMVYWQDIPSDTRYVSPFKGSSDDDPKYMTFEPVRSCLLGSKVPQLSVLY